MGLKRAGIYYYILLSFTFPCLIASYLYSKCCSKPHSCHSLLPLAIEGFVESCLYAELAVSHLFALAAIETMHRSLRKGAQALIFFLELGRRREDQTPIHYLLQWIAVSMQSGACSCSTGHHAPHLATLTQYSSDNQHQCAWVQIRMMLLCILYALQL